MEKDRIWTLVSRKLSGEATASELKELELLINNNGNQQLYLQAIDEYWAFPLENDEEFLEATYHLHLNRLKEKGYELESDIQVTAPDAFYFTDTLSNQRKSLRKPILISLGVLAVLVFFLYVGYGGRKTAMLASENSSAPSEVITRSGSRTRIQLPDGSFVWLNGSSKLVYDNRNFGKKIREVTLTGEAYFDVVKNAGIPFIIHANKILVKVMGTSFNIKAYPGEVTTEASLIRGSIEVSLQDRQQKIVMKPNDKLIVRNYEVLADLKNRPIQKARLGSKSFSMHHLTLSLDESTILETAWVDNKLAFDNESFEEVALKMERWYGVGIRFTNEGLKTQPLTGTFEKETIEEALQALQLTTPFFKYKIANNNVTIYK